MTKQHKSTEVILLSEIVTIQAGYPFRGAIRAIQNGSVRAVQAKDISELGELCPDNLIITDLTGKREAEWLQQGDVLFSAKGTKHIACYIDTPLENTICAPSLFLLRLKPKYQNKVNTQFLTWQINQQPIQNYLKRSAEGSHQISIRKGVLAEMQVALPNIEAQNTIAKLYAASIKENKLLQQLIINRQQQLTAIANNLINHKD